MTARHLRPKRALDLYDAVFALTSYEGNPAAGGAWADDAACRNAPSDWFYPPDKGNATALLARGRALCARCPVWQQCDEAGRHEHYGLWAGKMRS